MTVSLPAGPKGAIADVRRPPAAGADRRPRWSLPVYYGIKDLTQATRRGRARSRRSSSRPDAARRNLVQGISNGAIWALIAIGYTLVYGIIELINFAHGDVFMIGSFAAVGFWGSSGSGSPPGRSASSSACSLTLIVAMIVCGILNVLIERVAYRPLRNAPEVSPADHRGRLLVHPPERRAALARGLAVGVPDLIHQNETVFKISGVDIHRGDVLAFA